MDSDPIPMRWSDGSPEDVERWMQTLRRRSEQFWDTDPAEDTGPSESEVDEAVASIQATAKERADRA